MASSDAKPIPIKGAAYRVYFDVTKNDGTLLTGWTSPSATLSKDGATAAAATSAPAEIATSFGMGYLDLTASEMNADAVIVVVSVTNASALKTRLVLYPQEAGDILVTVQSFVAAAITAAAFAANAIAASAIADGAITAAKFASGALDGAWERLTSAITTAGSIGKLVKDYLDATISSRAAASDYTSARAAKLDALDAAISTRLASASYSAPPSAGSVADAVWDEDLTGHAAAGSAGAALSGASSAPSVDAIADAVLDELLADHTTAGSLSAIIAAINVKASLIGAGVVLVTAPVSASGDTRITQGVTYAGANRLHYRSTSARDLSAAGVEVKLEFDSASYAADEVTGSAGAWDIYVALTAAQTTSHHATTYPAELAIYESGVETPNAGAFKMTVERNP